ncbi:MAG: dihydroneopterin aldolase [Desulfuromonas sp.]|nr:dihydroneopterin aldolase [Desulfuromonas sp.]
MTDRIRIEELKLRTIIGITDEERHDRQDVVLTLTLFVDTRKAGKTDDIADSPVNYRTLTKRIIALVEGHSFNLIESLAETVAEICLAEPGISGVEVAADKPGALRFAGSVGVTIERRRDHA